ncbi:TniQ protein [Mariprofundus aestuarium]|uniref:TniQ protein n=1 Tax=Mariprofundus aestuarium TaxID=1921086 RepID=A0A2K8L093_MARES|nr:TniQ family protein [Mariprofundus aestuarium]ATX80715.1 TniQ protein [Mariprofundus aestuarium]
MIESLLAVFFLPNKDESTTGWLYRLAHHNAAFIEDFDTYSFNGKTLHELFIDCDVISHTEELVPPKDLELFISIYASDIHPSFSERYCPLCFQEDEIPYFREAWTHQWISHCLIHDTPLIEDCINCGRFGLEWVKNWKIPWGVCRLCKQRCSTNEAVEKHPIFSTKIKPEIPRLISLFNDPFSDENLHLFQKVVLLKSLLECDHIYYGRTKYDVFVELGIDPYQYRCCKKNAHIGNYLYATLEADAAYALSLKSISHLDPSVLLQPLYNLASIETIKHLQSIR